MKKLLTLVIALFLLAACQPTPEVDAVRQKNSAQMIEMARGRPRRRPRLAQGSPQPPPPPCGNWCRNGSNGISIRT